MALNEVLDEIRGSRKSINAEDESVVPAEKPKRGRGPKTKEEIEAYRERKMREEEARYLRAQKSDASAKKASGERSTKVSAKKLTRKPRTKRAGREVLSRPKMLQPLQPLYLLKIPGLPKGECLAICLTTEET